MSESGYSIEEDVFSEKECLDLIEALFAVRRSRAGVRHLMVNAEVAAPATGLRLLSIARDALGAEAIPFRGTLFEKSRQANWLVAWHQALPVRSR